MSESAERLARLSPAGKRALLSELLRARAQEAGTVFPLHATQKGIWFLYQLAPELAAYNVNVAVRIHSAVDVPALRRSFQGLIDRHRPLRTTFSVRDARPVQRVHERLAVDFQEIDAARWDEAEIRERVAVAAHQPFDLERGPLLRVRLFTRGPRDRVLLVTLHHIAMDFWSFVVLMDDLAVLYAAETAGTPPALPPISLHYSDYIVWYGRMLAGPDGERLWAYWEKELAGPLPVLDLPTDRPRPAIQTYRGASLHFRLDDDLVRRLKLLARAEGVTLFMVLLAAFDVVLARLSGQEDVLVSSPLVARPRPEFERMVGCFTNPVVLRADLSGNPPFREFLRRVRRSILGALEHQDYPALLLVERLKPARDPSRPRLYEVMFNMVRTHRLDGEALAHLTLGATGFRVRLGDLEMESFPLDYRVSVLDLEIVLGEVGATVSGAYIYNPDLFDAATIARMAGHYETLLSSLLLDPDRPIGMLHMLTPAERHQLLVDWNQTAADYPRDACIHELIRAQVERTPDAVAVAAGRTLTYRELDRRANRLARSLQALGVGPEALVGICLESSSSAMVALLGVLKAAGAYLPLDPAYPSERLAFILQDARPMVVLTEQRLLDVLPATTARVVCLDAEEDAHHDDDETPPAGAARPESLAYVIYTSGSTGTPKGVLTPHSAVVNHGVALARCLELTAGDRVLQFAPLSFDAAVEELVPTWLSGATVVLRPEGGPLSGAELLRLIEAERITVLNLPTAYWHEWVYELAASGTGLPDCLRLVVVGGEKVSAERFAAWRRVAGTRVRWINTYGPTEATITALVWEPVGGEAEGQLLDVPIGRPIANVEAYVLDERREPVPVGVPGELFIGGAGVARGYLDRPELTAERFVPDPFAARPGARLYRTGDVVRRRPDGTLLFVGRIDDQVKVRGVRIEPGEVEAVLVRHPAVRESVVAAVEGARGNKRLVAYVVPADGAPPPAAELRAFLRHHLPEPMAPSVVVFVPALPRTPAGKIDRRALPPVDGRPRADDTVAAPRTGTEESVAAIFAEVLEVSPIGIQDDFFELGGHSLMATQLVFRIREVLGVEVPLRKVFESPTVAAVAAAVEEARRTTPARSPLVRLQSNGARRPLFCVHPVGGSVLCYSALARALGRDQPLYGLQAPGLDGEAGPNADLSKLSARYLDAIRTAQPEGPYLLAGWSFGGVVAFEMAQQLQRQGERIALLAMLDSWAPLFAAPVAAVDEAAVMSLFAEDLGRQRGTNCQISPDALRRLGQAERIAYVHERLVHANALHAETPPAELGRLLGVWVAHVHAERAYTPETYAGPLILFRASQALDASSPVRHARGAFDATLGWSRLASKPVEVHEVPGDHYTMLSPPHVGALAERLQRCLARDG